MSKRKTSTTKHKHSDMTKEFFICYLFLLLQSDNVNLTLKGTKGFEESQYCVS